MPLKIVIAGAGIVGLATAIALGREGHEIHIHEKSAFSSEIGAAFHFGPYGVRILKSWSIDIEAMRPVKCEQWRHLDSETLEVTKLKFDLEQKKRELNVSEDEIMVYRIDAHNVLRAHALAMPNIHLHLGDGVETVDPSSGTTTLKSGALVTADVVIGADGVHSKTLAAISPATARPIPVGFNMYRFMLPLNEPHTPALTSLLAKIGVPAIHNIILHAPTHHSLVLYSCRSGTLLNCATFQSTAAESKPLPQNDYNHPADAAEVLHLLRAWGPEYHDLVRAAQDVKHWAVIGRDVPPSFVKSVLALVGDAAHPIMPTHAAGANIGVEDAGVLGVLLDRHVRREDVQRRLEMYNECRYRRCVVVKFGSEILKMGWGDAGDDALDLARGKCPEIEELPGDWERFLWTWDAVGDAREKLKGEKGRV